MFGEWQPIETAPKDGSPVLVYPPLWVNKTCSIAKYNDDKFAKKPKPYWNRDDCFGRITENRMKPPTHWMPLPLPPSGGD